MASSSKGIWLLAALVAAGCSATGTGQVAPTGTARGVPAALAALHVTSTVVQIRTRGGYKLQFTGMGGIGAASSTGSGASGTGGTTASASPAPSASASASSSPVASTSPSASASASTGPSASPSASASGSTGGTTTGGTTTGAGGFFTGWIPYVSSGNGSGVYLVNVGTHQVERVTALGSNATDPVVSGGGRYILYRDGDRLRLYDTTTQLIQDYPQLEDLDVRSLRDMSVDAMGDVAFVGNDDEVHVFNLANGQDYIVPTASRGLSNVDDVTFSGNGRFLTFDGSDGGSRSIYMTDLDSGRQYTVPFINGGLGQDAQNFALASDGNSLLYSNDGQARLLDLSTGFIDNLPLLNGGGGVDNATFLDAGNNDIIFERDGNLEIYDRGTGLVDTLPIVNMDGGFNQLAGSNGSGGFGSLGGFRGAFGGLFD